MAVITRPGKVVKFVTLPLTAGAASWQNTTGGTIVILERFYNITTVEGGTCTLDLGVSATDATSNTLLDGMDGNSATVQGSTDTPVACAANYFITSTLEAGTAAAVQGTVTFSYVKV